MFVENRWLTVGSSTANSSRRRKTTICRWSSESNRNAAATRWWVDISPLRMQLSSNTESRVWVKAFRFASITSRIPNVISFLFCPPFSNDMAKIIVGVFCCCWCVLACNILVEGTSYVYTLSNHGRRLNCSVTTLFPASISLVSLDVGFTEQRRLSRGPSSRHHLITHRSPPGEIVHNVNVFSIERKLNFV